MGSSSPTRDRTQASCIGSTESYPLRHQGSPALPFYISQGWIPLGGEFDSVGVFVQTPSPVMSLSRSPPFSGSFPSAWNSLGVV